jgi:uncharacterized Fe-S cluster-containing radical SAM superfamily protein
MKQTFPFDPIVRAAETEKLVMHAGTRLYYRFRSSQFYGGIATADAVGCSFLCAYCWNYDRHLHPDQYRTFYSPREVASRLLNVADSRSLNKFRVSGSEPLLGEPSFKHLNQLIRTILRYRPDSMFILETNGLYLGAHPEKCAALNIPQLKVRISMKGADEKSFEKVTGAKRKFFHYPVTALRELQNQGVSSWPALMQELFSPKQVVQFKRFLESAGISQELELEQMQLYPHVVRNLKKRRFAVK